MPALTVCNEPTCPNLTDRGKCRSHRRDRERQRPSARERGYDRRWELFALAFLTDHPICDIVDCKQAATDVDHIDGLGPLGPRGFDRTNCRPRCHPHHSQRTARDQPGGFNQR